MPDTPAGPGAIRIVVHAGFHKTATTTTQRCLRENAATLRPAAMIGLRGKLLPVISAARGYSTWRDPASLMKYGHRVGAYLAALPLTPRRVLCLSAEELSGHMPGRERVPDFAHVPDLMAEFATMAQQTVGPSLDLTFYFSTREPLAWRGSAWAEHVKASRLTLDLPDFLATHAALDPAAMIAPIRTRVAPHRVVSSRLEDCAHLPLGPAQSLIDLLSLPPRIRRALRPATDANQSLPPAVLAQFLALNRSDLAPNALAQAKKDILAAENLL